MAKASAFEKLNSMVSKKLDDGKNGFRIFERFGKVTDYISLNNYMLNAQISGDLFLGLPNTRSLEWAGKSGTGKTIMCLNMMQDAQRKGYCIYYIDTEGAIDEGQFDNFGIDYSPSCLQHIRNISTFEKLIECVNTIIDNVRKVRAELSEDEEMKVMIVIDSIGMLNASTALENALKGKYAEDMGKRAKLTKELFRNITLPLSNLGIPLVFTNHTSNSLDLFAIDKEVMSSGEGPTFAASFITLLGKANYLKEESGDGEKNKTGVLLRARSHKNRGVVPMDVKFHLSWKKGMNPYVGLDQFIGWDNCGVDFGTIMTKVDFDKKYKSGASNSKGESLKTDSWTKDGVEYVCVLNPNARTLAVKDTCSNENPNDIFTGKVFTYNTLVMLNEKVIRPMFKYSSHDDTAEDIAELVKSSECTPETNE